MYYSLWSYPWDLLDIGLDKSFKEMSDLKLNGVSITTSYHAGKFLQARSPKRKVYFPEDGTLYFPFQKEKYRHLLIQPEAATIIKENPNFWDQVFESASKYNLRVSAWTVCAHNTMLGMKYPEVTVKNAFGDPYYYHLCPSNEEVRKYMRVMIEDFSSQYPFYSLELESLNYMEYLHGYHHEKDAVGLTEKDQFLLSLCFCDSCKKRALKEGIDITPAQSTVKGWIHEIVEREFPFNDDETFMKQGLDYFSESSEVHEYLHWRSNAVTSLAKEIQEVVPSQIKLYFLSLLTPDKSWLFGIDFKEISNVNDGIVVCCYDTDIQSVGENMKRSNSVVSSSKELLTGLRLFYPEHNKEELIKKVQVAKNNGSEGFIFYNYGLVPKKRINWIKEAIEAIE